MSRDDSTQRVLRVAGSLHRRLGRLTGWNYFEDFNRVYPTPALGRRLTYGPFVDRRRAAEVDRKNYLNHVKFYRFAAQFAPGKNVADVGCGSGYGCQILHEAGARHVWGCDASRFAMAYARKHFAGSASFARRSVTDLRCPDASFDVVVSSEVLEHVKEYGAEVRALAEMRRVLAPGGLLVLGTPNLEISPGHGFRFEEIDDLLRQQFRQYRLFENALVPFEPRARAAWLGRQAHGATGVTISENINLNETVLPAGRDPELKAGLEPGWYSFADFRVDTRLLHNTHSWVALAVKE